MDTRTEVSQAVRGVLAERVQKAVAEYFDISRQLVTLETKFVEDLGADSLDLVEMTMTVEDEIGVFLPDDEVELVVTIDQLVDVVASHYDASAA